MRKKLWTILLTIFVFLSGAILGVSTVYRVKDVTVNVAYVTEDARLKGEILQQKLQEAYEEECTFFVNKKAAEEILKEYPYFRLSGFEKSYPKRLVLEVTENAEMYAIEGLSGKEYYILSGDGIVLEVRDNPHNPLNGEENVVMKGLNVKATRGEAPQGDKCFAPMLAVCNELSKQLNGIRSNVVSIEVVRSSPEVILRVVTREGVKLYFSSPDKLTAEKVAEAVQCYTGLSDEEKLMGRILLVENHGEIFSSYSAVDEFAS